MFTVKHTSASLEDMIYATPTVNYVPAVAKNCAPSHDSVWVYPGEQAVEITDGNVYVMNDKGATVSIYRLGESGVRLTELRPLSKSVNWTA